MTTLKEYIDKIEIIKNEIVGCDNLMEFYHNKKIKLMTELDELQKMEVAK